MKARRLLPTLIVCLLASATATRGRVTPVVWAESWRWEDSAASLIGEALYRYEYRPHASKAELFVLSPAGRRLILTAEFDSRAGTGTLGLRDDANGWNVEIEESYGIRRDTLHEFFSAVLEPQPPADVAVPRVVRTSTGFEFAAATPNAPNRTFQLLVEQLRTAGKLSAFAVDVPAATAEGVFFLDSVLGAASDLAKGQDLAPVVEVLAAALRSGRVKTADPYRRASWKGRVVSRTEGEVLSDPALELLKGFSASVVGRSRPPAELSVPNAGSRSPL